VGAPTGTAIPSEGLAMSRIGRFFVVMICVLAFAFALSQGDASGRPDLAEDFLDRTRYLEGDTIRFCVYDRAITLELDRAVAAAIADALLVQVEIVEVSTAIGVDGIDFFPFSEDELYIFLTNECQAFLGFTLAADVYPEWLTFSRPYASTAFVAVARADDAAPANAWGGGAIVGTTMLSEADVRLAAYLATLPEAERWRRFPYPHAPILLERLADETLDAALVWAPALAAFGDETFEVVPFGRFELPTRSLSIAMPSEDVFLRGAIDAAIGSLVEDGTLEALFREVSMPATVP
jgi:polar amino acid transport system substrate-binding protein